MTWESSTNNYLTSKAFCRGCIRGGRTRLNDQPGCFPCARWFTTYWWVHTAYLTSDHHYFEYQGCLSYLDMCAFD
jgi:hypothetical protein